MFRSLTAVFLGLTLTAAAAAQSGTYSDITEYPVPNTFPTGITAGPDGALWFTGYNGYIGRITTAGTVTEYPASGNPFQITSGPDGALWFTEFTGNNIARITTDGTITQYAVPTVASGPDGITSGPQAALWFTESYANKIGRISTAGVITEYPVPI
jgi:virginiamycin B lyase